MEGASSSQGPPNPNQAPDSNEEIGSVASSRNEIPCLDLINDEVSYRNQCTRLRTAAMKGDWTAARPLLFAEGHPPSFMLRMAITKQHETVLHIAVGARQINFARKIINLMNREDLILKDVEGNNAFFRAVATESLYIVKIMLVKNPDLATIRNIKNKTPLYIAVLFGREQMAMFLYSHTTTSSLTAKDRVDLFFKSIETDLYGCALKFFVNYLELIKRSKQDRDRDSDETPSHSLARKSSSIYKDEEEHDRGSDDEEYETPLHLLARKSSSIYTEDTNFNCKKLRPTQALQLLKNIWEALMLHGDKDIAELIRTNRRSFLFSAAKSGNFPFLAELVHFCPDAVHILDETKRSIFHIAILHRQTSVFNLINDIGFAKDILAKHVNTKDENMLHLAAEYPDPPPVSSLSNAALEMQQELILFEEIEKIVQPSYRAAKNANGLTPRELFTRSHRKLVKSGAEWMKSTASSCMVVATLIATVVFSAAFTVPGGNDDKTGMPLLLKFASFRVFAISDAIALSTSSFAILMFLSIITSGFQQTAFHRSLPLKLMIGILALFLSVVSMMVTFSSSYFLVYRDQSNTIPILSLIFVTVPVTLFVLLQYSLLRDIFLLTYRSGLRIPLHIRLRCFRFARLAW